jgi:hypothetical protein
MKYRTASVMASFIIALALPSDGDAQIPGMRIGLAGGPSLPLGALADEAGTGFHLRGSLGLEVPLIPLGVRGDLLWQQFPDEIAGNFTGLAGLLNATWRLPFPIIQPYLVGGGGFMRYSEPDEAHDDHAHEGESGTNFAIAAGAGVQLRLLGFGGFAEARYLDWGRHRAIPLTVGITF